MAEYLDVGLYTPGEAAMYARMPPRLVSRWLYGSAGKRAIAPEKPDPDNRAVTFLDFIQMLAVRSIRYEADIPLDHIRQTIEYAAAKYGITYPFARKHTIYILKPSPSELHPRSKSGGNKLAIKNPRLLLQVNEQLIESSGRFKGQPNIPPIVQPYLHEVSFDGDGLARRIVVEKRDNVQIVMERDKAFGEPLLDGHLITAWDVWDAVRSEGSYKLAARAYGISEGEARVACYYIDSIRTSETADHLN